MREIKLTVDEAKALINKNMNGFEDFAYEFKSDNTGLIVYDYTRDRRNTRDTTILVPFSVQELNEIRKYQEKLISDIFDRSDIEQELGLREFVSNVVI